MREKLEAYFLSEYVNKGFVYQKKAQLYLYFCFLIIFLLISLLSLYLLINPAGIFSASLGAGISIMFTLISLIFLKQGKFYIATDFYTIPVLITTILLRIIYAKTTPDTSFTTYVYYYFYLIVFSVVFNRKYYTTIITTVCLATNVFVYFIARDAINPVNMPIVATGMINSTSTLILIFVISTAFHKLTNSYAQKLDAESKYMQDKYESTEKALEIAQNSINIGEKLVTASDSMLNTTKSINNNLSFVNESVNVLSNEITSTKIANDDIVKNTSRLRTVSNEYSTLISQATSAITEMVASIGNISAVSQSKKNSLILLMDTVTSGESEIEISSDKMKNISNNASSIFEIINVIIQIADSTNILAMNAAIEAAHAGETGKGFAVVAEEIRRLAEQTNENIKIITDTLQKYFEEIEKAAQANKDTHDIFKKITTEIFSVKNSMEEIIAGMSELSVGTQEISTGVASIVNMSKTMGYSIDSVEHMIEKNNDAIESINLKSKDVSQKTSNISIDFQNIIHEAETIHRIGEENKTVINSITEHMDKIKTKQ